MFISKYYFMPYPYIRTSLKSTLSKRLITKQKRLVPKGIGESMPFYIRRGRGWLLEDVDGNAMIDFASGVSAVNLGHCNPKVVQAIQKQAGILLHTWFPAGPYELYLDVAQELVNLTPGNFQKKVFFSNSGAEAVENGIKIARRYTGRPAIVSYTYGFHGRTLLALSLTSKVKPYKFGFGPFAPEIYRLEYPYSYRRPTHCQTEDEYVDYLLRNIEEEFFKGAIDPEHVAAIIIEPVAGEGGFIVCPSRYLQGISRICKKYGIVLIADEIQTGFGRTGKWFACEHSQVEPDMILVAKSIASGMPLSAVIGRSKIMDSVQPGGLGGTFGGNPVSLAASKATLSEMKRLNLPKKAVTIGNIIMEQLNKLACLSPIVGDVRGLGAMCVIEIVKSKSTKKPDPEKTRLIVKEIIDCGVLILSAGMLGNDIRILCPLTISERDLRKGLKIVAECVMKYS